MSKREISIDVVKGITILLVILGHMSVAWVSTFHMMLFFVLSGYFINNKNSVHEFTIKKFKQLIIPYWIGCFLTILGSILLNIILHEYSEIWPDIKMWLGASLYGKGTKREILIPGIRKIGALWFLLATFYGSVIVRYFIDHKYMPIIISIIGYIGLSTRNIIFLPGSIQNGLVAAFFMMLGYYMRNNPEGDFWEKPCNKEVFVACSILWGFSIYNDITMSMVNLSFPHGCLHILVGMSALYVIMYSVKYVLSYQNKVIQKIATFFSFYGKNSLWILVFHAVEINLIRYGWITCYITENTQIVFTIEFFTRLFLCTVGAFFVLNIKSFLGKRQI